MECIVTDGLTINCNFKVWHFGKLWVDLKIVKKCGAVSRNSGPQPCCLFTAVQAPVQTWTMAAPISAKCDLKTDGRHISTTPLSVSETWTQPFKNEDRAGATKQTAAAVHTVHIAPRYSVFIQYACIQAAWRGADTATEEVWRVSTVCWTKKQLQTAATPQDHRGGRGKTASESASSEVIIMMLCLPTWRLWDSEIQNKKTSIRLVIAARLADVLFGMALGFSAEFGRNTPTGASWYNRAAWAAIHPACLTPFPPLFFSLSTHPRGSLPLSILPPPLPVWTGTSWLH